MIERQGEGREEGSRPDTSDAIIEQLVVAKPVVEQPSPDRVQRIFENAYSLAESAIKPKRRTVEGARVALTAAFCMSSVAAMLLLQSTAAQKHLAPMMPHEAEADYIQASLSGVHVSGDQRPPAELAHTLRYAVEPLREHEPSTIGTTGTTSLPPAPMCGMTSFAIFSAAPIRRADHPAINLNDQGSLVVCIISENRPTGSDPTIPAAVSDHDEIAAVLQAALTTSSQRSQSTVDARVFTRAVSAAPATPVLVGTNDATAPAAGRGTHASLFSGGEAGISITLPDFNTI